MEKIKSVGIKEIQEIKMPERNKKKEKKKRLEGWKKIREGKI